MPQPRPVRKLSTSCGRIQRLYRYRTADYLCRVAVVSTANPRTPRYPFRTKTSD